ncbi:MAG: adenylosuccinate synthase [Candidatus Aminicenantes bacterium]|nr:adenylosuccinate synthase [Candidatus Aminicenantes bacterium]
MANVLVVGTQWGDEGKGKVVDLLTPAFDIVARYQGGHNAGHTVYVGGRKVVLHLIPAGILRPGTLCVIGNGLVVSPEAFLKEKADLAARGVRIDETNLALSRRAHLIMPYHPLLEKIDEDRRGEGKIGTTCRGIGPAYEDKAARRGVRAGDLLDLDVLRAKIRENVGLHNEFLKFHGVVPLDPEAVFKEFAGYAAEMAPFIKDTSLLLAREIKAGKAVLFEGAQGVLLDLDHGTYPYVTSSSASAGGASTGLGVGPREIHFVLGVVKAYTTRVGSGPFPTELRDDLGKRIAARGDEFGATTGRPRRCGWFDAVAVAYACRVNGIDGLALTKPDVLEELDEIRICTGYRYKGDLLPGFPAEPWILEKAVPEYRTLAGWRNSVHRARDFAALPASFKDYVRTIEDLVEAKVALISTGVEREDTILIDGMWPAGLRLDRVKAGIGR